MFDYIIIGAGMTGAVMAERIASQLSKRVLIIERRNHIGGNCYDYFDDAGILVHKYGPHIFHSKSQEVWQYLSQFTEWNIYQHKVLAAVDGVEIPVPFNLNSLKLIYPQQLANSLTAKLISQFGYGRRVPILDLLNTDDSELKMLAQFIYDKIFVNFTYKQWGLRPEDLEDYVMARVPVIVSHDDRYFADEFQGVPRYGYTKMFENMLAHQNIKLMLNTDYRELLTVNHHTKQIKFMNQLFEGKLIYTGKIDELFDFCYGELPYRSLDFKFITLFQTQYQAAGTIHYPNDYDFTRITEMKQLTGQNHPFTTIVQEFPRTCGRKDIPYYPVPQPQNHELFTRYQQRAAEYPNIIFSGRLADYRFYDMHEAVSMALNKFAQDIGR